MGKESNLNFMPLRHFFHAKAQRTQWKRIQFKLHALAPYFSRKGAKNAKGKESNLNFMPLRHFFHAKAQRRSMKRTQNSNPDFSFAALRLCVKPDFNRLQL
jgi:hypothetical protein